MALADEVIVVTVRTRSRTRCTRDWASVARKHLGVPVLHIYGGSSWIG